MDMFTGDMEEWLHHAEVDDTRHAVMLGEILQSRDFSEHSDASNIQYAFEMAKWVAEHFEYLTYARSNDLEGEALPKAIKSLIAHDWQPGGELHIVYPFGSSVSVEVKSEEQRVSGASTLEKLARDIFAEGKPFAETVQRLGEIASIDSTLPDEHAAMKEDTVTFESVEVDWQHPMSFRSGLKIIIEPTNICIFPYGDAEHTSKLHPFAVDAQQNVTALAETVSELVVLAAQNCHHRTQNFFTDRILIDNFADHLKTV